MAPEPTTSIEPRTDRGRAGLQALMDDPATALLALDFDGTLAPIVADPTQARALPEAVTALAALAHLVGNTAIVTGRPAATAVEYAGLRAAPGLHGVVVLGHYGLERWDADRDEVSAPPQSDGVARARRRLPDLLAEHEVPEAYVEDKGSSLAVHTRQLRNPEEAFQRLRQPLQRLAEEMGLALEPGRLVLELRPRGVDKGAALRSMVAEVGARTVVFAGDDLGDLAAFDAVDGLRAEGVAGLLVCSGSAEEEALAARADLVVDGPEGVAELLATLAALLEPG